MLVLPLSEGSDRSPEGHQQKHWMPPSSDRRGPPSDSFGEKQPGGQNPPSATPPSLAEGVEPQPVAAAPRTTTLIVAGSERFFVIVFPRHSIRPDRVRSSAQTIGAAVLKKDRAPISHQNEAAR